MHCQSYSHFVSKKNQHICVSLDVNFNESLINDVVRFEQLGPDIFHISIQNIDCGYSLEPPRRGGSNKYAQSMFLRRNKKNNVYSCKPQFYYIKMGFKGSKLYRYVFVMLKLLLTSQIAVYSTQVLKTLASKNILLISI